LLGVIGCQILRLKCTKFDFRCGSTPDPVWELTALPRPLAAFKNFKGPIFQGREGKRKGKEEVRKGKVREG